MRSVVEAVAPARLGRPFRWLLGSSWVSNLGDGIALAAGPLLVASQTRDPFLVALAVVLQRLPWLLFGLLAGVVADRFDRRRIIIGVHLARAAVLARAQRHDRARPGQHRGRARGDVPARVRPRPSPTRRRRRCCRWSSRSATSAIGNARIMAGFVTVNQLAGPPLGAALFAVDAGRPVPRRRRGCMVTSALLVVAGRPAGRTASTRLPGRTSAVRSPRASDGSGATPPCGPSPSRSSPSTSPSARPGRSSCSTPSSGSTPARSASGCSRPPPRSAAWSAPASTAGWRHG